MDFCSGACALFDYEDHMVCAVQIILILAPFFLLQRKPQEEVEEGANEKQPKSKNKKKSSKKKKSTAVTKWHIFYADSRKVYVVLNLLNSIPNSKYSTWALNADNTYYVRYM